ncbi:DUF1783-domain-containing protein [Choiromyces venosus 120613-1]|uniref:DUF1783-domain-containing protein n=1 Tax=Choiromyces venosus 120613-1 TaxID=1336337 RepID=A0A3N4IV23_9PEZI|nr:DUF1783-domain-containing protein [Choiromyces venosus 120613-1]
MLKSLPKTRIPTSTTATATSSLLHLRPISRPLLHPFSRKITTTARPIGTFTERRSDRTLPDPSKPSKTLLTLPLFASIILLSAAAIFNYQKSSSSVVSSTLYALRVHPRAKELLGEDISFKSKMPWIHGTLSQLRGDIDIAYGVKGTKGEGVMRFRSVRRGRMGLFETLDWSLLMDDGHKVLLLDNSAADPFPQATAAPLHK